MPKSLPKDNGAIPIQQEKRKRHQELISVALEKHLAAHEIGRLSKEILTIDNQPAILPLPNGQVPSIAVCAGLKEPNRLLLAVLATLHHYDISDVTVTYSGCGDSGTVDEVGIIDPDGSPRDFKRQISDLQVALLTPFGGSAQHLCNHFTTADIISVKEGLGAVVSMFACQYGRNWCDGDGGGGEARINVPKMRIHFDHYTNSEENATTEGNSLEIKDLDAEIREYLGLRPENQASQQRPKAINIVFQNGGNQVFFAPHRSTIKAPPPPSFTNLAQEIIDAENLEDYALTTFHLEHGSDQIEIEHSFTVISKEKCPFEIKLHRTFSLIEKYPA
jgi:hypothetical protein